MGNSFSAKEKYEGVRASRARPAVRLLTEESEPLPASPPPGEHTDWQRSVQPVRRDSPPPREAPQNVERDRPASRLTPEHIARPTAFQREATEARAQSGVLPTAAPELSLHQAGTNGDETSQPSAPGGKLAWVRARGHALTCVLLFLFSLTVYLRPADWWLPTWPLFDFIQSAAFYIGAATLLWFWPAQLATDGAVSVRPREFYYVLTLLLMGFLAIPFADQDRWWARFTFGEVFLRAILIFIVMINVLRTERRWRFLLLVPWGVGVFLAWQAFSDYISGKATLEGYRIEGAIGGMFSNPNDLSQHFVTMLPLAIALLLTAPRGLKEMRQGSDPPAPGFFTTLALMVPRLLRRAFYLGCAVVLLLGTMVTFSRSGFLATVTSSLVMTWKFGRQYRVALMVVVLVVAGSVLVAAPGQYRNRVLSIVDDDLEVARGSASSRKDLLKESIKVSLRHPLFGLGMGNFRLIYKKQTHNAYTQVSAEMGLIGLAAYLFFLIAPMRRLYEIEKATVGTPDQRRFYYLAVGLQASLVAYLVGSFFGSIAYYYNVYYLVGFAVSFRLIYYQARKIPLDIVRLPAPATEETAAPNNPPPTGWREDWARS